MHEENHNHGCCCHSHNHTHSHSHKHCHGENKHSLISTFRNEIICAALLIIAFTQTFDSELWELFAFIVALIPIGWGILRDTIKEWLHGDIFNEFTLMVMACIGAFCIGEYPEGVAILLFYSIGEKLEDVVSGNVRGEIKKLLGKLPDKVTVEQSGNIEQKAPQDVKIGEIIAVKPGESVSLDGELLTPGFTDFNTAAITGESMPKTYIQGEQISSGTIPVSREVKLRVTHAWNDSSMTRIIKMIEDAENHRSPSETLLRKITRWYTPIVFAMALLLTLAPWVIAQIIPTFEYEFFTWLRRSLIFLVCSCPCALIVSIPLTYFASIGIASSKGILFKGHDSLDNMRRIDTIFFDKTGTVTTGQFQVSNITCYNDYYTEDVISNIAALEKESQHPIAQAILEETEKRNLTIPTAENVQTSSHGMTGCVNCKNIRIGSKKLFEREGLLHDDESGTAVYLTIDDTLAGKIELSDTTKSGVRESIANMHKNGINRICILSGDTEYAVANAAREIGADDYRAQLLPEEKQQAIKEAQQDNNIVAFAGDGINDAPALATANVGIAMGTAGTDIAIESAQVVIAGDEIGKINDAIAISRQVKSIIIENVVFAFGIKGIVMTLGAFGIATLWAAVFADTGVTLITIIWTLYRLKIWKIRRNITK